MTKIITHLEFGNRETSPGANSAVIFDGGAADNGAELVDRTRGYGCRFDKAGITTTGLAARLFETERVYQLLSIIWFSTILGTPRKEMFDGFFEVPLGGLEQEEGYT